MSHAGVSISLHIFSTCCCCYYDASRFLHSPGVCRLIGDKMLLFLSVRRFHLSLENLCKVYHNLCVKLKEKRQHFSNWLWGMMQIRLNWGNSWFCFFRVRLFYNSEWNRQSINRFMASICLEIARKMKRGNVLSVVNDLIFFSFTFHYVRKLFRSLHSRKCRSEFSPSIGAYSLLTHLRACICAVEKLHANKQCV